jgi:hypothetical protein
MSIALNGEGTIQVNLDTYPKEPKCSHNHARGAESLANWLYGRARLGRPRIYTDGAAAKRVIATKTGIIFFKNCFTWDGESRANGDHIDLWDKSITRGFSDPSNNASEVWFWELS